MVLVFILLAIFIYFLFICVHLSVYEEFTLNKCMTKMENFAGSRKVAHILNVWALLSAKIPISSRSVENSLVMSHSPTAPLVLTNSAQIFFAKF
jgi:hypothetical protein